MSSIELGDREFYGSLSTVISSIWMIWMIWWIDLPHLNSIKLGSSALFERWDDSSCSLKMESDIDINELIIDLPNLTSITSNGSSFCNPYSVTLSSLILNDWMMNRYSKSKNSQSILFSKFF